MKKISIILLAFCLLGSCKSANPHKENIAPIGYDVLYYEARDSIISLTGDMEKLRDSIIRLNIDKTDLENNVYFLKQENNSLKDSVNVYKEDALVYKYKIERIKAYDKIVRNNSSQSKFFLGWVRRVLED